MKRGIAIISGGGVQSGPLGLAGDVHQPLPLEAFAANADAIAQRAAVALDQVEMALGGLDDDGARRIDRL